MGDEQDAGLQAVYLVVEPDPLLRADLAETLLYHDSTAAMIVATSANAALPQIAEVKAIRLALVACGPCDYAASHLSQMIQQKGGAVVLMGDRAEDVGEAKGFRVLHRPFSQTEVLALIGA